MKEWLKEYWWDITCMLVILSGFYMACNESTKEEAVVNPELAKVVVAADLVPLEGTGKMIITFDVARSDMIYISCDNANRGNAKWYSIDSLNKGFIELKVLNLDNGFCYEYYKDHYEPKPKCIDTANCAPLQEYNTLGVGEHDIYTDSLHVQGDGRYIGSEEINAAFPRAYTELDTKNNKIYFGFHLSWLGDHWEQIMDSTLLTPKNRNALNRMK